MTKSNSEYTEYQKAYKEKNRERLNAYGRAYSEKTRLERKEQLYELKTPCVKCGENRPYVIDFHHINPADKRFNISTRGTHYAVATVKDEIKKCVCLCRNCHTEFHYIYGNQPDKPVEALTEYLGRNPYEV